MRYEIDSDKNVATCWGGAPDFVYLTVGAATIVLTPPSGREPGV